MNADVGVPFEKWEGLGNDFVLVEQRWAHLLTDALSPERICDRHFGVGADGVLIVSSEMPLMRVHNADGSTPEMCGNGLRCVAAAYVRSQDLAETALVVDTAAGPRAASVRRQGDRAEVAVRMGRVSFDPRDAGVDASPTPDGRPVAVAVGDLAGFVASIGNPHWIVLDAPEAIDIKAIGPGVERNDIFANRTNVELVRRAADGAWQVDVWERGVGITLACGSGACCVAATLVQTGRESTDTPIRIRLPGGELRIRVSTDGEVEMTGPARFVFSGTLPAR